MDIKDNQKVINLNPGFDSMELLKLIEEDYDTFENELSDDMKPDNCKTHQDNKVYIQETKFELNITKPEAKINCDQLKLEEGEIRIEDSKLLDITPMFQDDKSLSVAFHETVQRQHLILKIYENAISCPLCKLSNKT